MTRLPHRRVLEQCTAMDVLRGMDLNLWDIRRAVEREAPPSATAVVAETPITPRVKKVLAVAPMESKALNHTYVGTEHLLLALMRVEDGLAAKVLEEFGLTFEKTRQNVLRQLDPDYRLPPKP